MVTMSTPPRLVSAARTLHRNVPNCPLPHVQLTRMFYVFFFNHVENGHGLIYIPEEIRNMAKIPLIVAAVMGNPSWKFHENQC